MTLITVKSKSIPKRAIIGLEQEQAGAVSRSGAYAGAATNTSQVRATSADKSTGFLDDKLTVGQGITKNVITDSKGNQRVEFSASTSAVIYVSNPNGIAAGLPAALSYDSVNDKLYLIENTSANIPIGVILTDGSGVQTGGLYTFPTPLFTAADVGASVYWTGDQYTTVHSPEYNVSIGVVAGLDSILIQIAPIDTHTPARAAMNCAGVV